MAILQDDVIKQNATMPRCRPVTSMVVYETEVGTQMPSQGWELKVKMVSGEIMVPMTDSMQLSNLKKLLAQKLEVFPFQLRLAHLDGQALQNDVPLTRQGLGPSSAVSLIVTNCEPVTILVHNKGRSRPYTVKLTDAVAKLKQQVCQQEKVEVNLFWLAFEGRPMEDHRMLGDYDLTPQCTVFMNFRLRGGSIGLQGL
ncbi:PREDICTED: ubiquitin-like protein ISG15 [Elephantulus edwardii]|uniref:ubiquitin-like protein ISG15 n=1 Tax=Elephantulus edwardii TaxID=28737 RepID=UPI0003F08679|nr:PREDICTED: ubiquitin-like protein ISG15 [Elephantulus edwardii]